MPRIARQRSSTGVYHVMLRGINRQIIFKDEEDYEKLIETIEKYKEISKYEIFAYCLMPNHIHLLIKEAEESLGMAFRRIGASYVYWYNRKYRRVGHLFQDRYRSEAVEDDSYFKTVLRYIHRNPMKAGIVNNIAEYSWSSYNDYLHGLGLSEREFALSFFAEDEKKAVALFKEFNTEENDDKCLEYEEVTRVDDLEADEIIKRVARVKNAAEVRSLERVEINRIIKELRHKGLSIRQIERLTTISFAIVRAESNMND